MARVIESESLVFHRAAPAANRGVFLQQHRFITDMQRGAQAGRPRAEDQAAGEMRILFADACNTADQRRDGRLTGFDRRVVAGFAFP